MAEAAFRSFERLTEATRTLFIAAAVLTAPVVITRVGQSWLANYVHPSDCNERMLIAAIDNDPEAVEAAIRGGADINAETTEGANALFWFASHGNDPMVERLLKAGADPNIISTCRWSPLLSAADKGHASTVRLLLAGGADPNDRGLARHPIVVASANGHKAVVELLRPHCPDEP